MSKARFAARLAIPVVLALFAPLEVLTTGHTRQDTTVSTRSPVPKRLPDGQPDIQGVYLPTVAPSPAFPIERFTQQEREAYDRRMLQVRGPNVPAHGSEWTEGALRALGSRMKPGTVMVVDPPDG